MIMNELAKIEIELPESLDLRLFLLPDNQLQQIIEQQFQIRMVIRGHLIKLLGPEAEIEAVKTLLDELLKIAKKNGRLTSADIETAIHIERISEPADKIKNIEYQILTSKGIISARTAGQEKLLSAFNNNDIVFAIGPAGTGKTYLAVAKAVHALRSDRVRKIVLARPAVEAGESLGFLPGDFKEKVDPYLKPLYDALEDMLPFESLKKYLDQQTIEILPLAFMRGRTLNNAFVILDEAQNTTFVQMKMFLTRLGKNSRAVITGDITQIDLPSKKQSGLISSINLLNGIKGIKFIHLKKEDIVRHTLVKEIIDAYDRYDSNSKD